MRSNQLSYTPRLPILPALKLRIVKDAVFVSNRDPVELDCQTLANQVLENTKPKLVYLKIGKVVLWAEFDVHGCCDLSFVAKTAIVRLGFLSKKEPTISEFDGIQYFPVREKSVSKTIFQCLRFFAGSDSWDVSIFQNAQ